VTLYTSTAAAGMLESATVSATRAAKAGYVIKQKEGRCNRYQIRAHLQLPDPTGREHIGRRSPGCASGRGPARHRTALAQLTSGGSPDHHRPAHETVPGHNQLQRVAASPVVIQRDDRPVAEPRVRGGAAAGSTVSCMVSSFRFGGGWDLGPAGRSHASAGPLSSRAWAGPACGMR